MDEDDKVNATSAGIMGFFGVTEGSIPFAAKDPKVYMPSFMIGGFFAGMIAIFTGVGNSVALFGGPIIYLAGGMGQSPDLGGQIMSTDYAYALLYFIPLIIGSFIGFLMVSLLNKVYSNKNNKLSYELKKDLKSDKKKQIKGIKVELKGFKKDFKKAKIDQKEYQKKEILDYKSKIKELKNQEKAINKEETKEYQDLKDKIKDYKKLIEADKSKISDLHFKYLNKEFANTKKLEYRKKLSNYLVINV